MAKKVSASSKKARIDHSVYGTGTIVEANAHHTTIDFDEAGTRKFVTSKVELQPSDTPAPEKPRRKKTAKRTTKK